MKVDRRYKIEQAAADRKGYKPKLESLYLDCTRKQLIATDGHILAIVPAELSETDTTGYVSVDAFTAQRKTIGKRAEHVELSCNGAISLSDGRTFSREDHGAYPNVEAVLPDPSTRNFRVALNPTLLLRLAEAMGTQSIDLHFDTMNPDGCILVKGETINPAVGAIMPVKIKR